MSKRIDKVEEGFEEFRNELSKKVEYQTWELYLRYNTRCCFNVHSKADMSQLIYHMEQTTKKWKTQRLKSRKKLICSEVSVNTTVWGNHVISPEEEKEGYCGKDLQKRKVLSLK